MVEPKERAAGRHWRLQGLAAPQCGTVPTSPVGSAEGSSAWKEPTHRLTDFKGEDSKGVHRMGQLGM